MGGEDNVEMVEWTIETVVVVIEDADDVMVTSRQLSSLLLINCWKVVHQEDPENLLFLMMIPNPVNVVVESGGNPEGIIVVWMLHPLVVVIHEEREEVMKQEQEQEQGVVMVKMIDIAVEEVVEEMIVAAMAVAAMAVVMVGVELLMVIEVEVVLEVVVVVVVVVIIDHLLEVTIEEGGWGLTDDNEEVQSLSC